MALTSYLLSIDKDLLKKSKIVCITEGISLRQLLLSLLEDYVKKYDIDVSEKE